MQQRKLYFIKKKKLSYFFEKIRGVKLFSRKRKKRKEKSIVMILFSL